LTATSFDAAGAPLDLEVDRIDSPDGVEVVRLTFEDGGGGRGSALAVDAAGTGRADVGILVAHGGFEPGAHIFLDEACSLARRGVAVLLPETTFPRSHDVEAHEAAIFRAIRLQRRGLDVLAARSGATRFGFFGHSAGGAQGAILAAVESRLAAIAIAATGVELLSRMRDELMGAEGLERITRFDPGNWVTADGDRALLFQHGSRDAVVTKAEAHRLFELAAGRKSWAEYDCDHGVDGHEPARRDRLAFFERELAL
jgi:fermentation-respiration switch protein FrsA (DUF1100 family)